jgi:hypothetical protein
MTDGTLILGASDMMPKENGDVKEKQERYRHGRGSENKTTSKDRLTEQPEDNTECRNCRNGNADFWKDVMYGRDRSLARHAFHDSAVYKLVQLGQKLPLLGVDFHIRIGECENLFIFRGCQFMVLDGFVDHFFQLGGFLA